jgi:hypothetical protein
MQGFPAENFLRSLDNRPDGVDCVDWVLGTNARPH